MKTREELTKEVAELEAEIESLREEVSDAEKDAEGCRDELADMEEQCSDVFNWAKRIQEEGLAPAIRSILSDAIADARHYGIRETAAITEIHDLL